MKTLMMLSAVTALVLGGSAYAAGEEATVRIKAPEPAYKLAPAEFDDYAHHYSLSNGEQIRFAQAGQRYWANLRHQARVELYPMAPNVFVTAAGTRVEFREQGEQVVIDNFERLPMAVAMSARNVRVVAAR